MSLNKRMDLKNVNYLHSGTLLNNLKKNEAGKQKDALHFLDGQVQEDQ